jgi:hypothetical protein
MFLGAHVAVNGTGSRRNLGFDNGHFYSSDPWGACDSCCEWTITKVKEFDNISGALKNDSIATQDGASPGLELP